MQEITITLSSDYLLKLLKDNWSIFVVKDNDRICLGTSLLPFYGPKPKKYLLYYDVDEYLDCDSDDEAIQDLKDACSRIKEVKINII